MYTITVTLKNPITSKTAQLYYQFDPNTLDQAKWSAAFPAVAAELATLKTASTTEEPPVW
jgi:hypothetical protein